MDSRRQRLEHCVRTCGRRAWAVAFSLLRNHDEAMDAVQQAFLVAARKPRRIPNDDPWPWFGVVVAHEARNLRRKKRPATNRLGEGTDMQAPEGARSDPSADTERSEIRRRLRAALDDLPPKERDAVVLTHMTGMSHAMAAEALGIPRQTLSARVGRGLDRLGHRLRSEPGGVARSLALLPIAAPRGGFDAAAELWTQTAVSALSTTTTTAAATTLVGGAALMSSKIVLLLSVAAAIGVGYLGGTLVQSSAEGESAAPGSGAARAFENTADWNSSAPTLNSPVFTDPDALVDLQREAAELRGRLARAKAHGDALEKQLASMTKSHAGPTFTFGRMGQLPAVKENDWQEMARAAKIVVDGIHAAFKHKQRGEPTPTEVHLRIQENADRMRKYEFRTYGKMPTAAKYNGENTHPISMANLVAALLVEAGKPLSADQIERINSLGLAFEEGYARLLARHTDGMPRIERLLLEYRIKGRFIDDVVNLLTDEQRKEVYSPGTHKVTGLDLHSPTQMIAYTSPIIVGESLDKICADLRTILAKKLKLEVAESSVLEGPIDAWAHEVRELVVRSVPAARLRHYTYEEADVAGQATLQLTLRLLKDPRLSDAQRTTLMADRVFYIPRILKP